jgi:hypothetical protein
MHPAGTCFFKALAKDPRLSISGRVAGGNAGKEMVVEHGTEPASAFRAEW